MRGFSGPAAACWWLRRLKAVRKVGEVTQRLREEGVLAKHGQKRRDVTSDDDTDEMSPEMTSRMTLEDLGINRNIAAAGVKLLSLTPEQIDAKAADSASATSFSRSLFPGRRQPLGSRRHLSYVEPPIRVSPFGAEFCHVVNRLKWSLVSRCELPFLTAAGRRLWVARAARLVAALQSREAPKHVWLKAISAWPALPRAAL